MSHIWVWLEQFQGKVPSIVWETMGVARQLADTLGTGVTAVWIGGAIADQAEAAIAMGADVVQVIEHPALADFRFEPYLAVLTCLAKESAPSAILMGSTARGRELAGGLAAELGTATLVDVMEIAIEDGRIVAIRPIYEGKLFARTYVERSPAILTIRGRAFPRPDPDPGRKGEIRRVSVELDPSVFSTEVLDWIQETEGEISLNEARIVVGGGRGVGGPEGFETLRELARALGAALGATRAVVDAGWIPYKYQVGQTGKTISPDLYIACGVSGAIQHLSGLRGVKVIVAINNDPEAPIFKAARYGVVDDLFKIVPALTAELRRRGLAKG
ncbi:MAG: electron transfer flavoprotein subunit alpha/FixB family protein [Anaerolineae bacterium]|nr:electron transfer flavoprotein subunit alpha/FixB family protein [Anaerolineae bacterium]